MPKIAVYAICKNEAAFVDRWIQSMSEADYICVLDTGSTDGCYEKLMAYAQDPRYNKKLIVHQKTYNPWRFDTPRNDSLALVPDDAEICICTDLDEILTLNWADELKSVWKEGVAPQQVAYLYAWSHNGAKNGRVFWYNKIHDHHSSWTWKYPVHETLICLEDKQITCHYMNSNTVWLHHYPDQTKSRGNYLPLLELRAQENPHDDFYGKVYLAHEYYYRKMYRRCIDFIRQSVLPLITEKDDLLCAPDSYLFLGKSYEALGDSKKAEECLKIGITIEPSIRECYLALGEIYIKESHYAEVIDLVNEALKKTYRHYSWLEWDTSWTYEPWDLLSIAYFYSGCKHAALDCALLAKEKSGNTDQRLIANYECIKQQLEIGDDSHNSLVS